MTEIRRLQVVVWYNPGLQRLSRQKEEQQETSVEGWVGFIVQLVVEYTIKEDKHNNKDAVCGLEVWDKEENSLIEAVTTVTTTSR